MNSLRLLLALCAWTCTTLLQAAVPNNLNLDSLIEVLDVTLAHRAELLAVKEQQLTALRQELAEAQTDTAKLTCVNHLFGSYIRYDCDSAYQYAQIAESLAHRIGSPRAKLHADIQRMHCAVMAGLEILAGNIEQEILAGTILPEEKIYFYWTRAEFYLRLRDRAILNTEMRSSYQDALLASMDSLCHFFPHGSDQWKCAQVQTRMADNPELVDMQELLSVISLPDLDEQTRTESYLDCGLSMEMRKRPQEAQYYYALAALNDLQHNTRLALAMLHLAEICFRLGDLEHAGTYIEVAKDDAEFYGSQLALQQITPMALLIEQSLYLRTERDNRWQRYELMFCAIILLLLCGSLALYLRRNKRLNRLNNQLADTVKVRDRFIFDSLAGSHSFVEEVSERCKTLETQLKAEQYQEALKTLRKMGVKREMERQRSAFDVSFQNLYPRYLDEFNRLFPAESQVHIAPGNPLPTEVRIFALMHLGIIESEQISRLLHISAKSLYVYKAKVKAASLYSRSDFDQQIAQIKGK